MEKLELTTDEFKKSAATDVGTMIERNQQLKELGLSGNRIGDEGAEKIGAALAKNGSLTHLDIGTFIGKLKGTGHCGIGRAGIAAIMKGADQNATLARLTIGIFRGVTITEKQETWWVMLMTTISSKRYG